MLGAVQSDLTTPAASRPPRVLCVGYEPALLAGRAATLQSSGFIVACAATVKEVRSRAARSALEAVVIGHLVPEHDRKKVIAAVRGKSPRVMVVLLYHGSIRGADCADAVLSVDSGPKFLANSLRYLLLEPGDSD